MQPDNKRSQNPIVPQRDTTTPVAARPSGHSAAANVVRGQIDNIYSNSSNTQPLQGAVDYQPETTAKPQEKTRQEVPEIDQSAWQTYHSAWQDYYQQYYERYYVNQVHETERALAAQAAAAQPQASAGLTEKEAIYELRNDLIGKVKRQATKAYKSRHFWPIAAAISVVLIFLFLQYNRVIFANVAAYLRPGNVEQSNVLTSPSDFSTVSQDDRLVIPKINVDVPIIWTANAADQNSLNEAMNNGVVWFNVQQAHSRPGEKGNFVLSGHSSNDWLDGGEYKFIFAPLEQLKVDDTFYVNYQQKRYIYKVTHTKVVLPTDVNALQTDNSKPVLTLITCTPLGTALKRLLVFAEQVSPDPNLAATPSTNTDSSANQMPTNSPTFLERLFGAS